MTRLVFGLLRPYRGWLAIVFVAMLVEIVASLAAPWPLKLVLDDALGKHHLPDWLAWAHDYGFGRHALGVALFAGVATLVIAVVGAVATYIDNYYTTSVGQWVANDLRIRIYEHLHRLSLRFYDTAKTGTLMSTITSDVATIQSFASSSTLSILVDIITIIFMIGLMFWLDWDFTLIAVGFTPFLIVFLFHFKKFNSGMTGGLQMGNFKILATKGLDCTDGTEPLLDNGFRTTILSASTSVLRRWVIMMTVRPFIRRQSHFAAHVRSA
jgi:subfamily B ATP-binding cassette protein MsbA